MPAFNYTPSVNITDFSTLMQWYNVSSGNWWAVVILIAVYVILIAAFSIQHDVLTGFSTATFIGAVISILLFVAQLIPVYIMLLFIVGTIILVALNISQK